MVEPTNRRAILMDDDQECLAEMIDGSWTYCSCRDCIDRQAEDAEAAYEMGMSPWE